MLPRMIRPRAGYQLSCTATNKWQIELKGGRPGKELDSAVQEICNAGWEIQDWDVFGHGFW